MKKPITVVVLFWMVSIPILAQGEIDEQTRLLFRDERSFAGFLNTNGFGANYRYGFWRNARNQFIIDGDFSYVKHPKEVKTTVAYDYTTHRYTYGKKNLFWELKGTAGWQKELFRKIDKGGISVRLFYSGGVAIGFLKPIYYEVYTLSPIGEPINMELMKFDLSIHQTNIGGRGPFFKGFNELKVVPGLLGKAGLSFEYGKKDAVIHALEAGVSLTVYPREIPIMATEANNFLFFNLMVGYRFGTIVDISEAAKAKTRRERRQERNAQKSAASYPTY
jgi:hypothetical protein